MSQPTSTEGSTWGASARDWAAAQEGTLRPLFAAVQERANIGPGSAVLDVACGTGLYLLLAQERGATVAGIDASAGQLEVARERLPNGDLRQGFMDSLPFEADSFDLISICNALQYAGDPIQALGEMKRVAKPGGSVAVLTGSLTGPRDSGVMFGVLAPFRAQSEQGGQPSRARAIFNTPGALEEFLQEAGLVLYEDQEVECPWDYPDLETAQRGMLSFAPGVRAIRAHGKEPIYAALAEALEPYRTESGGYHLRSVMRYVLAKAE